MANEQHAPSPTSAHAPPSTQMTSGTYARADAADATDAPAAPAAQRVLVHPDPRLARFALEVDPQSPRVVRLAEALVATMRASPACVGLAAPQVGVPMRVFCMDVTGHKRARSCAGLVVLANPRVLDRRGSARMREGCMSVPDATGDVARAAEVVVEGAEPGSGRLVRLRADAIEARCVLHEIDHLDGVLFLQRVDASRLFPRKVYA